MKGGRVRIRRSVLFAIAAGGALGTPTRYAVGRLVPVGPSAFPWSTFVINVSGCLLLGLVLTLVIERWPPSRFVRPFVAIGFLGAYTTFSTYAVEADLLVKDGQVATATAYVIGSFTVGLVAVYLGVFGARLLPTSRRGAR